MEFGFQWLPTLEPDPTHPPVYPFVARVSFEIKHSIRIDRDRRLEFFNCWRKKLALSREDSRDRLISWNEISCSLEGR